MRRIVSIAYTLPPASGGRQRVPYERITHHILGSRYELSLVLCGDSRAKRVNRRYRRKFSTPNVLSFPLSKNEGEIFLNVHKAAREAKRLGVLLPDRLAFLFIHGCLHLKGLRHGRTMEREERRVLGAFGYQWHGNSTQASTSARTTLRS